MATIFTRIINGEIPCYKVAEDANYFAFLDINPLTKGHTLVVPKVEEDYIFNLDDTTYGGLMLFAKKVAKALKQAVPCKRIGVAVMGMEVPHARASYSHQQRVGHGYFQSETTIFERRNAKNSRRYCRQTR